MLASKCMSFRFNVRRAPEDYLRELLVEIDNCNVMLKKSYGGNSMKTKLCLCAAVFLSVALSLVLSFLLPIVSPFVFGWLRFGALCLVLIPLVCIFCIPEREKRNNCLLELCNSETKRNQVHGLGFFVLLHQIVVSETVVFIEDVGHGRGVFAILEDSLTHLSGQLCEKLRVFR